MTKENNTNRPAGLGIGYVSIMIIFAVITLTVFAVLSFRTSNANRAFCDKNAAYTTEYYAADSAAKEILARLDSAAAQAVFFTEDFTAAAAEIPGVSCTAVREGVRAEYSLPINDRLDLSVCVLFFGEPADGARFRIERWQTVTDSAEREDEHLDVWDGNLPDLL